MTMTPYEFGKQLGGRMKAAGMLDDSYQLGSQMWNNSARTFKGMAGATAGALGAAGGGLAAGGMQAANAVGGVFGKQPFSNEAIDTAYGAADTYADVGSAYGKDFGQSVGLGAQGLAGTTQPGNAGDTAWQNLTNQPGVSPGARDFSTRARNVVNTAANIAPAAAIGNFGQVLKPFQATQAAGAAPAATLASRMPATLKPVMNAASTAQKAYGTTNNAASAVTLVGSGMATPH